MHRWSLNLNVTGSLVERLTMAFTSPIGMNGSVETTGFLGITTLKLSVPCAKTSGVEPLRTIAPAQRRMISRDVSISLSFYFAFLIGKVYDSSAMGMILARSPLLLVWNTALPVSSRLETSFVLNPADTFSTLKLPVD